jgi:hypothetical protein
LRYQVYGNALIAPSLSKTVYRDIDGAVFDSELHPIEKSLLTRSWTPPQISYPPDISGLDLEDVEVVEAPHIYGGYFFNHFGHFLLESLARAWVVEEVGCLPFVWASGDPPTPWQSEIFSLLGVTSSHRFPRRPTLFRRLVIADPGYRIQTFFHPRQAHFLGRWDEGVDGERRHRVWLSRTGVSDPRRRHPGEDILQNALAASGWRIAHPERMSIDEQLRTITSASVVAGIEGSAFHAAVLLKRPPSPFVVLRRGTSPNYRTIADRKGIIEFDLYGARRVHDGHDRKDLRLSQPRRWAGIVDELADRIEQHRGDLARLEALRQDYESRYDFERWRRRQSWRSAAPVAKAALRRLANIIRTAPPKRTTEVDRL